MRRLLPVVQHISCAFQFTYAIKVFRIALILSIASGEPFATAAANECIDIKSLNKGQFLDMLAGTQIALFGQAEETASVGQMDIKDLKGNVIGSFDAEISKLKVLRVIKGPQRLLNKRLSVLELGFCDGGCSKSIGPLKFRQVVTTIQRLYFIHAPKRRWREPSGRMVKLDFSALPLRHGTFYETGSCGVWELRQGGDSESKVLHWIGVH